MATVDLTASQSWVVPTGVTAINVTCLGGGGGGGKRNSGPGGGGGGGQSAVTNSLAVTPSESLTVTIGAAGIGAVTQGSGTAATATSIKRGITTLVLANGGSAGATIAGGAGGTGGTGGTLVSGVSGASAGSGGAGGAAGTVISTYGTGGNSGDGSLPTNGANGIAGLVRIAYSDPALNGTLSATIAAITLTSDGTIPHQGTVSITIEDFGLSATGALAISGSLDATISAVTLASEAIGGVNVGALLDATLGAVTLSALAGNNAEGSLAVTITDFALFTSTTSGSLWISIDNPTPIWGSTESGLFDDDIFDGLIFDTGTNDWHSRDNPSSGWIRR